MTPLHTIARSLLAAALLAIPAAALAQGRAARPAPVEIVLLPEVRADGPVIRLGHIAQLTGGEPNLRAALANLDLAEFRTGNDAVVLGRADVKFRLLVAGHDARFVRFTGAAHSRVQRSTGALTEAAVVHAARQLLLEQLASVAQPLTVRPSGPVLIPAQDLEPRAKVRLYAQLTPAGVTLGITPVDVNIAVDGQTRAVIRTSFEVQPALQSAVGLGVESGVDDQTPATENPIVIHSRDRVRMLARVGESQIIAAGEALQDGRIGQSIRLRNVDSNKTVLGRVLGPGLVEVDY